MADLSLILRRLAGLDDERKTHLVYNRYLFTTAVFVAAGSGGSDYRKAFKRLQIAPAWRAPLRFIVVIENRQRHCGSAAKGKRGRLVVQLLVAAVGALITHQIAYLLAWNVADLDQIAPVSHGHLPLQWALITPLAVGVTGLFTVRQIRLLGFYSPISTGRLGLLIIALFTTQEMIEGLVAQHSVTAAALNPALLIGLLVAPAVAWTLGKVLTEVGELVARILRSSDATPTKELLMGRWFVHQPRAVHGRSAQPRAPPVTLISNSI